MALDPSSLSPEVRGFLTERHLASLTTLRADGSPHVCAVGFTWDDDAGLVRVTTWDSSRGHQLRRYRAANAETTNSKR